MEFHIAFSMEKLKKGIRGGGLFKFKKGIGGGDLFISER